MTRRQALGMAATVAAGSAAAGTGRAPAHGGRERTDVLVVGAGFAGLAAATRLREAGVPTLVLEARDRVGGRVVDLPIGDGEVVEMGGEWAGPGQDRLLGLARELGVRVFESVPAGRSVYLAGDRRLEYEGEVPPVSRRSVRVVLAVSEQLGTLAAGLDDRRPWATAAGRRADARTVGGWLDDNCPDAVARRFLEVGFKAVYGVDSSDVSLLDLLSGIRAAGGDFSRLLSDAQTIRFAGGPQQLATGLARRLGPRVRLGHPVERLTWTDDSVTAAVGGGTVRARRAIVTLPAPLAGRLPYEPPLRAARDQLTQRQPMGSVIKFNVVYDRPFWRAAGLNGTVVADTGPVSVVADNSPASGRPGVLVAFMEGSDGKPFLDDPDAARAEVLRVLERGFGPPAGRPRALHAKVWAADRWTRGAYGTYNPPGFLSQFGDDRLTPVGPIHWAGSELARQWPGYIDGALESGHDVADAVLRSLR